MTNLMSCHDDNTKLFMDLGGCALVTNVLKKHINSSEVLSRGFATIRNFTLNADTSLSIPRNSAYILLFQTGITDVFVSAFKLFPNDVAVQWKCCWAIESICNQTLEMKESLGAKGVCTLVVDVLRRLGKNHLELSTRACGAIEHMSDKCNSNIDAFVECGACQLLIQALNMCPLDYSETSHHLVCRACQSIAIFTYKDEYQDMLGDLGVCEAIMRVIETYPQASEHTGWAIWGLVVRASHKNTSVHFHSSIAVNAVNKARYEILNTGSVLTAMINVGNLPYSGAVQIKDALSLFIDRPRLASVPSL